MPRTKNEDTIIIDVIFPERYYDYPWEVEIDKEKLKALDHFTVNTCDVDGKYEFLALIENEEKMKASDMLESNKNYKWKHYFLFSPYVRIFGIDAPVVMLPELKEIMEKTILIFTLINKYVIGESDVDYLTYSAIDKLIKIHYHMKNKSDSGQESQATELTPMELKSLSEDILGFNVWEDETGVLVKVDNKCEIDALEERELNHGEINERIQNIIKDYEIRNSGNIKKGKARIELKNYKGFVVEISSYLKPIMQGILSSYEIIPWIYGKESLHNEFSYSCLVAEGVPEEDWRNLEILTKVLDYQKLNCFCKEKFLENYYFFLWKTLRKIPDEDTKYLVFYATEKIYSLELFEIETRKLYNYIHGKNIKEGKKKTKKKKKKKEKLILILNRIFKLNGARGKIELAEQVLDCFFENIDSSIGDLMNKIDDIFVEYEKKFIFVKKDEVLGKSKLKAEIKECGKKEWEWYNDRHEKALMFENKYKEWEKEYFLPEEMKNVMIFVMKSSVGHSLDFELDFSDGHKIWGEKDNEPVDFLCGMFEEEECADDNLMEVDGKIVFFNEAEAVAEEDSDELAQTAARQKPKKGKREEDLSGLPVVVIEHSMSEEELEKRFGKDGFKQLPDEVYRRYGFTPAKVEVEEHHVKVYAGKKTDEIVRAPHPESLLRGSLVSASLEAAVMKAKYVNAVPLYCQEQEFERYGLHISRQNMANWIIQCADRYLAVLYDYLHEKMYGYRVLQADEMPVLMNKDGRPAGVKSFMWVYRTGRMYTDRQIVLYEYQKTRNASHPREFLRNFSGICVTDGYQIYHTIETEREDLRIAGCWSHARRRFDKVVKALPKAKRNDSWAYLALTMIQAIYREEELLKALPVEEREKRRQLSVRPLVEDYFAWIKENIQKVPQKGKTWEGFNYCINQEKYLKVFLDDGEVPMDNNAAGQSIRGFCVGKKNWVMIDTVAGAKSSAIIYSIAETAKANNLKPYDYFEYLLTEIPKHLDETDRSFLNDLLPWSPNLPANCRKSGKNEVK